MYWLSGKGIFAIMADAILRCGDAAPSLIWGMLPGVFCPPGIDTGLFPFPLAVLCAMANHEPPLFLVPSTEAVWKLLPLPSNRNPGTLDAFQVIGTAGAGYVLIVDAAPAPGTRLMACTIHPSRRRIIHGGPLLRFLTIRARRIHKLNRMLGAFFLKL